MASIKQLSLKPIIVKDSFEAPVIVATKHQVVKEGHELSAHHNRLHPLRMRANSTQYVVSSNLLLLIVIATWNDSQ